MDKKINTYTDLVKCSNCNKTFRRFKKRNYHGRNKVGVRGKNCITCSPECSKKWIRRKKDERENT